MIILRIRKYVVGHNYLCIYGDDYQRKFLKKCNWFLVAFLRPLDNRYTSKQLF